MTALRSEVKNLTKMKIRRKRRKINLPKEIRYIEASTVFIFYGNQLTVNLKLGNYITLFKTSKILTFLAPFFFLTLSWLIYFALSQVQVVLYYFIPSHIHWIYLQLLCMFTSVPKLSWTLTHSCYPMNSGLQLPIMSLMHVLLN